MADLFNIDERTYDDMIAARLATVSAAHGISLDETIAAAKMLIVGVDGVPAIHLIVAAISCFGQVRDQTNDLSLVDQVQDIFGWSVSDMNKKKVTNLTAMKQLGSLFCASLNGKIDIVTELNKKDGNPWLNLPFSQKEAGKIMEAQRKEMKHEIPADFDVSAILPKLTTFYKLSGGMDAKSREKAEGNLKRMFKPRVTVPKAATPVPGKVPGASV